MTTRQVDRDPAHPVPANVLASPTRTRGDRSTTTTIVGHTVALAVLAASVCGSSADTRVRWYSNGVPTEVVQQIQSECVSSVSFFQVAQFASGPAAYVRDPDRQLTTWWGFHGRTQDLHATLPADATLLDYTRHDGARLYLGPDRDYLYLVVDGHVERFPLADQAPWCV